MSFQHFRLTADDLSSRQQIPQIVQHLPLSSTSVATTTTTTPVPNPTNASSTSQFSTNGQLYGSGDVDDGYTLVFPNLEAFHAWKVQEEETQIVEFVKGDTHGSKAVPPRFKDHTKLVCARHSRSGRKKYVKKYPDRVRKVPSRKLDGPGCLASISFKTYYDTDQVRVCYVSQHSHETGLANLPFTRKGRKEAAERDKSRSTKKYSVKRTDPDSSQNPGSSATPPASGIAQPNSVQPPPAQPEEQTQNFSHPPGIIPYPQSRSAPLPHQAYPINAINAYGHPPLPPHQYTAPPDIAASMAISHDRWERMAVLFHSVREHARGFEFSGPSVVALESVLLRLFLETPVGVNAMPGPAGVPMGMVAPPQGPPQNGTQPNDNPGAGS